MEDWDRGIVLCYTYSERLWRVGARSFTFLNVLAPYAFSFLGKQDQVTL